MTIEFAVTRRGLSTVAVLPQLAWDDNDNAKSPVREDRAFFSE
jgi:hypothetical protein